MQSGAGLLFNRLATGRYGVVLWLAIYGIAWIAIPQWSNASLPADVVEELAWGREWPLQTYRHPPMMVWLLEIGYQATGKWQASPYLLSALSFCVAQLCFYRLLKDVRDRTTAFAATVVACLIPYFGVHLPQWNANVAQYAFVGLFILCAWRALNGGKGRWWVLAGVAAAAGTLAKFTFVLIPASVAALALADPWFRARLHVGWLLFSGLLFSLLVAPTVWLTLTRAGGDATAGYLSSELVATGGWLAVHLQGAGVIVGTTLAILILPWIVVRFGMAKQGGAQSADSARLERLLAVAALGPLAAAALAATLLGVRIKDHWLLANLLLLPPWFMLRMTREAAGGVSFRLGAQATAFAAVLAFMLTYPLERAAHYVFAGGRPVSWTPLMPVEPLAAEVRSVWEEALQSRCLPAGTPLAIVGGLVPAAMVASALPERPQWFEEFNPAFAPWVEARTIRAEGLLSVAERPPQFAEDYGLDLAARRTYEWRNARGTAGLTMEIAAYLPRSGCP